MVSFIQKELFLFHILTDVVTEKNSMPGICLENSLRVNGWCIKKTRLAVTMTAVEAG